MAQELKSYSVVASSETQNYLDGEINLAFEAYDADEVDAVLAEKDEEIAELKEERRWRKFSEEKPKEKQWILVFVENPSKYGTYIELRRWDMGCKFDVESQELYTKWMPQPKAPEEADK